MDLEQGLFGTLITSGCPMVFKHAVDDWASRHWTPEYLCSVLGDKLLNCKISIIQHQEFQWEPDCLQVKIRMRDYVDWLTGETDCDNPLRYFDKTKYSCYIDYKYMKDMFKEQPHLLQSISWGMFGLVDHGGEQSTIWIGSSGTYTPCHQDAYGFNLVSQIQGRKRWYLISPDQTDCMYPTRIPYEESSIYSEVNVRYPDLDRHSMFQKTTPYVIELVPGDVLYVPRHWWHFVESLEPSISINTWVPVLEDAKSQLEESVARLLYTCLSTSLLSDTERTTYLNTGEELQSNEVNLHYLQTTAKNLLTQRPYQNTYDNDLKTCEALTAETKHDQLGENRRLMERSRNNWQKFYDKFKDYNVSVVCLCGIDIHDGKQDSGSAVRKRKCHATGDQESTKEEVQDNQSEMRIKLRKTEIPEVKQNVDISELKKKNVPIENVHIQEHKSISKERREESGKTESVEHGLEKDVSISSGQSSDLSIAHPQYSRSKEKANESAVEIYAAKYFTFDEYVKFLETVFDYELKSDDDNNKTVDLSDTRETVDGNIQVNNSESELGKTDQELGKTDQAVDMSGQPLVTSNTDTNTGDTEELFDEDKDISISTVDIINSILDPRVITLIGHVLLNKIKE